MEKRMKRIVVIAVMVMLVSGSVGCNKRTKTVFEKPAAAMSKTTVTPVPTGESVYTPTAIPAPVEEVLPTETVTPAEEPVFNEKIVSTEEPVEVPTEEPIPTEEVVSTKEPMSTPILTATPAPTATTALTSTPAPTSTPKPTTTPKPTVTLEPTATPTPIAVKGISVGDTIVFGNYEQDNNLGNGKEPIEWYVLDIKDGNAFLLAKYVLDYQPFDSNYDLKKYNEALEEWWKDTTQPFGYNYHSFWEKCSIREWLNNTFFNAAFTTEEKEDILLSEVENLPNSLRGTGSGPDTKDRIYLLSESEAVRYFGVYYTMISDENEPIWTGEIFPEQTTQMGAPTEYAKSLGVKMGVAGNTWSKDYCFWFLRTAGGGRRQVTSIYAHGFVWKDGGYVNGYSGIRPCLWINITT